MQRKTADCCEPFVMRDVKTMGLTSLSERMGDRANESVTGRPLGIFHAEFAMRYLRSAQWQSACPVAGSDDGARRGPVVEVCSLRRAI